MSSLSCLIWFWSPFLLWLFLTCSSSRPDPVCLCPASVRGLDTEGGFSLYTCVVQRWGTEEVAVWLEQLSLGEYKETFIRHDIRGSELLHLERRDLKVYTQPLSVPHDVPQNNRNALSLSISLFDSLSLSVLLPVTLFAILCCTALLGFHCASVVRVSEYLRDLPPDARRVIISRLGSEDAVVWWAAAHRHASVCVAHDYSQHVYVFVIRGALWANQALFTPAMNVCLIRSDRDGKISNFLSSSLPFKCLGSVRFLEEVFYAHQGCIYLIKNTVITVIL